MRTLIFAHLSAWTPATQNDALAWLREYARKQGAELFDPLRTRIVPGDVVHVFSNRDPETWHWIRMAGARVQVTPLVPIEAR